ncbi:MAG: hypothetical protein AAFY88_20270, partial [Acidobacteriota bacterium]
MDFFAKGYFTCDTGTGPANTEDYGFWAGQLADYLEDMQNKFYTRCADTSLPVNANFCQDLDFGTWEGVAAFEVTETASSTVWPKRSAFGAIEFIDFIDGLKAELATRTLTNPSTSTEETLDTRWSHFNMDHWVTGACHDAQPNMVSNPLCAAAPDPADGTNYCAGGNDNVMCFDWEYGRLVEIERQLQSRLLRFGFSNFLGSQLKTIVFPTDAYGNQLAVDMAAKAADEYVTAGGYPDFLQAFIWHRYPTETGDETQSGTAMNLIKGLLEDPFHEVFEVLYLLDVFDTATPDWDWTLSSDASILSSPPLLETDGTGSSGAASAALSDEDLEHASVGVSLNLTSAGGTGRWAAVQLRPQGTGAAAEPMGATGGISAVARFAGDGFIASIDVYHQDTLLHSDTSADLADLTSWFRLGVDLRAGRLRVAVSYATTNLRILDIEVDDSVLGDGPVVLTSTDATVWWDNLEIYQYRERDERLFDDFNAGVDVANWSQEPGTPFTGANNRAEVSALGFQHLTSTEGTIQNLRISGRIEMDDEAGWAGFHLR